MRLRSNVEKSAELLPASQLRQAVSQVSKREVGMFRDLIRIDGSLHVDHRIEVVAIENATVEDRCRRIGPVREPVRIGGLLDGDRLTIKIDPLVDLSSADSDARDGERIGVPLLGLTIEDLRQQLEIPIRNATLRELDDADFREIQIVQNGESLAGAITRLDPSLAKPGGEVGIGAA